MKIEDCGCYNDSAPISSCLNTYSQLKELFWKNKDVGFMVGLSLKEDFDFPVTSVITSLFLIRICESGCALSSTDLQSCLPAYLHPTMLLATVVCVLRK